jgi:hypothetical protein
MILTIKLFTFAFDYHDGLARKKDDSQPQDARAQVTAHCSSCVHWFHRFCLLFQSIPIHLLFLSFVL